MNTPPHGLLDAYGAPYTSASGAIVNGGAPTHHFVTAAANPFFPTFDPMISFGNGAQVAAPPSAGGHQFDFTFSGGELLNWAFCGGGEPCESSITVSYSQLLSKCALVNCILRAQSPRWHVLLESANKRPSIGSSLEASNCVRERPHCHCARAARD